MFLLFHFLSLRYWNRHRGALFLSSLGVALGIAVFTAIQVANHSVLAAFSNSLDAISGKATLQITAGDDNLPEGLFTKIKHLGDSRIQAAAPVLSRTFFSPTVKTSLLILGIDVFSEADFRTYDFSEDNTASFAQKAGPKGLEFLTAPKAIAISEKLAQRANLHEGDALKLFIGARRETFRIQSILRGKDFQNAYGGDFALMDIAAAQEAFGQIGKLSRIDLMVADEDIPAVSKRLRPLLPPDTRVQRPAQRGAEVAAMLAAFRLNLGALSCIAIFVGAFLIYNAIASAVVRRRAEVGTLRSIGASAGQLRCMFLLEAACIGAIGSVAGLLLGIALSRLALGAVSTTVSSLYVAVKAREIVVPLWLWWGAPCGGVLLSVLAAWPAASEAGATSPRAASMEVTLHQTTTRFAVPLALGGVFILLIAGALCHPVIASRSPFFGFAAAFCTLAGFAALAPLFTLHFGRLLQNLVGHFFGVEGTLAATQLQRSLNRSSLVIASLMVSLAMAVGMAVMVGSFRSSVERWVTTSIRGDLYVATATGFSGDSGPGLPREVVNYILPHPKVKVADVIRSAEITLTSKIDGRPQPVYIAANDLPALATGDRAISFVETAHGESDARQAHLQARGILVSERFKNLLGYGAGATLTLPTPEGDKPLFIAGVFYDYTPDQAVIYLPRTLYRKYWHDDNIDALALHLKPGVAVSDFKAEIDRRFAARYQFTLLSNAAIRQSVFTTFDNTFRVTYALQLIAVLVAAVGIFETLWSLILERRREIATLRAMGASSRQITKTTLIEFGLVGLAGWTLGMAAGLCLAWQLIFVINRQFFGWTIAWSMPLLVPVQALLLALAAAIGAGFLPSIRAARQNIAKGLQRE